MRRNPKVRSSQADTPKAPKQPKTNVRPWLSLGLLLLVLGSGWQSWRWWSWAKAPLWQGDQELAPQIQVEIPSGTSSQAIGQRLQGAGLIRSSLAWNLWAQVLQVRSQWQHQEAGYFQAGVYRLSPTQSLEDVANTIWLGQTATLRITIPEGWSLQRMAQYFQDQGFFSASEFLAASRGIPQDEFPWLPPNLPHLEGFLYPDTYDLPYGTITPDVVIRPMLQRFEQVALPEYQASSQSRSLLDWVILASIVEKEAVVPPERRRIAGVLANRLDLGMLLQVDPTVEYGLGIQQTPDRPLTLSDVQTPSPYNTYLNPGLPPTPIASPGLESLKAVLDPETTDYLYFVARYDGTHVFSTTLEAHEAAQAAIRDARDNLNPNPGR